MKVTVVDANLRHLHEVLEDMRDWERVRCARMFGEDVEREAARILSRSLMAYAAVVDGRCVALWGVFAERLLSEEGYLWMLGTKFLESHPLAFLRHSKRRLEELRGAFPRIYGATSVDIDEGSEKWMKWLGFEVGAAQGDIRPFVMR